MKDLNSNTHFKLVEKIQLDSKSPLRILVGFLTFMFVMTLQSFFILRFFGNSALDFLLEPLIVVTFFTSLSGDFELDNVKIADAETPMGLYIGGLTTFAVSKDLRLGFGTTVKFPFGDVVNTPDNSALSVAFNFVVQY